MTSLGYQPKAYQGGLADSAAYLLPADNNVSIIVHSNEQP